MDRVAVAKISIVLALLGATFVMALLGIARISALVDVFERVHPQSFAEKFVTSPSAYLGICATALLCMACLQAWRGQIQIGRFAIERQSVVAVFWLMVGVELVCCALLVRMAVTIGIGLVTQA